MILLATRRRRPLCNKRAAFYSTKFEKFRLQRRLQRFAGLRVSRFPVGASIRRLGIARASYSHLRRSHSRRPSPSSSSFHALRLLCLFESPATASSKFALYLVATGKLANERKVSKTKDTKRHCSFAERTW